MAQDSTTPISDPIGLTHFADIAGRNTSDNLLRTAQQHHVQLSTMADMKANILITVSSIVLTLSLRELAAPEFKHAALVLAGFTLAGLVSGRAGGLAEVSTFASGLRGSVIAERIQRAVFWSLCRA